MNIQTFENLQADQGLPAVAKRRQGEFMPYREENLKFSPASVPERD